MSKLPDFERQLSIARDLLFIRSATAADLRSEYSVSRATLLRDIQALRHLGADIRSEKLAGAGWSYYLANPEDCKARVLTWLRLERERTVLGDLSSHLQADLFEVRP
jgi:biotin operon repressor